MDNISTIEHLTAILPNCKGDEYVELVKKINLNLPDFEGYDTWSNEKYTRNLISRNEDYELILLCWEEGQVTPIHCHNNQECWVYAVEGSFEEIRYDFNPDTSEMELSHKMQLSKGKFSYMNDEMGYHSLRNTNAGRTVSLHLYINPIEQCRIYDENTKELNWRTLHYDNQTEASV